MITATLLLVAGVEAYNGFSLRQDREAELRNEAMQLARIAALDMDRILEGARQLLATIAKLPRANGWDGRACSVVAETVNDDFEYDYIGIVETDGQILCTSHTVANMRLIAIDADLLEQVRNNHGFVVGSYGRGQVSHNELLKIGYPLTDGDGNVVGAVYAGINATWLNTAINQWPLPRNVLISIADRNGIVIARNPGETWVGHQITEGVRHLLQAREVQTLDERNLDGVVRLMGVVPPDVAPSRGLLVAVGLDRSDAIAKIDRAIWSSLGVILAVLLAAAIAAWIYTRRFIDRPFRRLLSAASAWRSGDWSVRVAATTGIPEFDRMAVAFDEMAAAVQSREERIQRSEEHLAHAQHVAAIGSFEYSFKSGAREWSAETFDLLGINPASGLPSQTTLEEMVAPKDRERFHDYIAAALAGQTPPSQEFEFCRPDGAVRTIQVDTKILLDDGGKPQKLIGIYRDTTELRAFERQRNQFEEQLRHGQKLEALGTLAGGIAHDLNNALVPVVTLSDYLLKRAPAGSREQETMGLIDAGGKRARELVQRILTFARKEEPRRETLNLVTTVTNALKLLRASVPSTIAIVDRISAVRPVYADEGQIGQILTNLVTNSAQAIGSGLGTITVSLAEIAQSNLPDHGPAIRLSVEDTGRGMDEATRRRVFDPFFTTKKVGQGTGLGLSVVHGIVTTHGGFIAIDSEPGHGTRVDVDLPILAVVHANTEGEAA